MTENVPAANPLSTGIADFVGLLRKGMIYVDKTDLIVDLVNRDQYVFLSRPRRFGKSLLISTLKTLFTEGASACQGLKAEKLWTRPKRKVLHLDFSDMVFQNHEEFLQAFDELLTMAIVEAGFEEPNVPAGNPLLKWRMFLSRLEPVSLVLLVDEYDSPLSAALNEPELFESVRSTISGFFIANKKQSGKFDFTFITGIMKFPQASIFSAFNNIVDISLDEHFGTLLGYTEAEIRSYFSPYLEKAALYFGLTVDQLIREMAEHYDGYCFEATATKHVFSPWSVQNFLRRYPEEQFGRYWVKSGGSPRLLINFLKENGELRFEAFDKPQYAKRSELESCAHILELDPKLLLTNVGYLTIKGKENGLLVLGYPNQEVRESFAEILSTAYWPQDLMRSQIARRFVHGLEAGNPDHVLESLNELIHRLSYQGIQHPNEELIRQIVQVFCEGAGLDASIERVSPSGRSDLELETRKTDAVLEFKMAQTEKEAPRRLEMALAQIEACRYGFKRPGRPLLCLGLVFAKDTKRFAAIGRLPD